MTLDRATLTDAFVDALRQANRAGYIGGSGMGGGGGGGGAGGGGSSGFDSGLKKEGEGLKDSFIGAGKAGIEFGAKLFEGGARVSDATGALSKGLQAAGMGGSYLGKAFSTSADLLNKLGTNIDQNVDTWRKLSDTGASFNNDIFEMKNQASNARLSIAEMSDVVRKNSENLAGLGATVGQSTKEFSKVSDKFFSEGLGTNLTRMGYNTKELNDVLAVSVSSMRLKDLQEKGGAERAAKSAAALATEMDEVAKITGKSKQEQLDDLRRKQADGQRQAAIDLAIQRGGAGAAEAFNQITTTAAMGGKNFQKLAEDVAAMGRPSEGMEGAYAALGSEAQKLLQEAGAAARSGNQELAQQRVKEAAEARARFQQTEEYRTLAAQGLKEFGDQYGEGKPLRKAMEAAGGSMKDLEKSVKDAQAGIDPDTGKKSPGAAITEFAVDVESRGRDLTKALNDNITQPLVNKIGPQLKKFSDELNLGDPKKFKEAGVGKLVDSMAAPQAKAEAKSALDSQIREQFKEGIKKDDPTAKEIAKLNSLITSGATSGATATRLREMAKEKNTDIESIIKDAMANKGAGVADLNKQLQQSLTQKEQQQFEREQSGERPKWMSRANKSVAEDLGNAAGSVVSTVGQGITGFGDLFSKTPGKVEVTNFPTRHEGTVGKTGQLFEPTDFFGIMKKGETMLTPEQLTDLVKGSKGAGLSDSMAALQQSMKAAEKSASPKLDVSALSSQFTKTISSSKSAEGPTGVSAMAAMSTIGLNDKQKDMFKELASLTEEQATQRKEQLQSELDSAKKANKAAADARDVIEERYEKEGRLSELAADEEFKRLGKELNGSYEKIRATEDAQKVFDRFEKAKETATKLGYDLVTKTEQNKAKIVEETADKINADMKEALPVKELSGQLNEAAKNLDDHGKTTLKYAMTYSSESNEAYKVSAERSLASNKARIEDANKQIAELEEKGQTQELSVREKSRIERLKGEVEKLNENNKFREQEISAYKIAEEQKTKNFEALEKIVDKSTEKIQNDIKEAIPVDTEFGDLDAAIAKQKGKAINPETGEEYTPISSMPTAPAEYDEFAGLDEAIAKNTADDEAKAELERESRRGSKPKDAIEAKMPSLSSISFGKDGMPMFKQAETAKQSLAPKPISEKKSKEGEAATEADKKGEAKPEKKTEAAATSKATLDDVVKGINQLNSLMSRFVEDHKEIGNKQIRAVKSNSADLYAR